MKGASRNSKKQQSAAELSQAITQDVRNLNSLSPLLALLTPQTVVGEKEEEIECSRLSDVCGHVCAALAALCSRGITVSSAGKSSATAQAAQWVSSRINATFSTLSASLCNPTVSASVRDAVCEVFVRVLSIWIPSSFPSLRQDAVNSIVSSLSQAISAQTEKDVRATLVATAGRLVECFASSDLVHHFLISLSNVLKSVKSASDSRAPLLLLTLHEPSDTDNSETKAAYASVWKTALACPMDEETTQGILRTIDVVLPMMSDQLTALQFLTSAYEAGGLTGALSLKGVYYLMTHNSLDFPDFYTKLYALFTPSVLHSRHAVEFLLVAEQFMYSQFIPVAIVCAFIKKLARISLTASPSVLLMAMPFCYNLMSFHPSARVLLTNSRSSPDPYLPDVSNPAKSLSETSYLWEFEIHLNHYLPDVSKLAHLFQDQKFDDPPFSLQDFSHGSYKSMFENEVTRNIKTAVSLEYRPREALFADYDEVWNVPRGVSSAGGDNDMGGDSL